jgi:diadenosine tetraphosphate (Ap4A) HIT family hydrolase/5-methylcytosine-specific restriction endonuclease McrA
MNFDELCNFIKKRMVMSHIYQPVMIKTLVKSNNTASVTKIAKEFLSKDQSQIDYYKEETKNMVGRVLRKHQVVKYEDGDFILNSPDFSEDEKNQIIALCDEKIKEYEEKYGKKIWKHRARDTRAISGSLRYQVLKNAKDRCELCGISKQEKALDIDHIIPVNKGGKTEFANLQALCYTCNSQKRDLDDTDFRNWKNLYEYREKDCTFCNLEGKAKSQNMFAFAIDDKYPVTKNHKLIIPKRHVRSFFELGNAEYKGVLELLKKEKEELGRKDATISAFNVGINDGKDSGQTIIHCHIHLIPRRKDDVSDPTGGVRGIFPEKRKYP